MPAACEAPMRVAFVTSDGEHVDGELRRAPSLALFDVTHASVAPAGTATFREAGQRSQDRVAALGDADLVYVSAIGPSMAARVAAVGVRVATTPPGTPIRTLLAALQRELAPAVRRG